MGLTTKKGTDNLPNSLDFNYATWSLSADQIAWLSERKRQGGRQTLSAST